jgi:CRISPR-associated protein Csm4
MKLLKAKLEIKTPLVTPLQADTLFGHVCWGLVFRQGERKLDELLSLYDQENPPLVFSNGFPEGMLPFPHLTPYLPRDIESSEESREFKRLKKVPYLPLEMFLGEEALSIPKIKAFSHGLGFSSNDLTVSAERMHNTINRVSGTTGEDAGLYSVNETWYTEKGRFQDVYIYTTMERDIVERLIEDGLEHGYGADRSTGKGRIDLVTIGEVEFPDSGYRTMALANFVPSSADKLVHLRAGVMTKYGKLGEHFVHLKNPFKKPIVMYQAGATWDRGDYSPFCGQLLGNVHDDPAIRHHALSPIIHFNEEDVADGEL